MSISRELTPRQKEVLEALCQWIRDRGYPPSIRELGETLGLSSTRSVHDHLGTLERKGYIRRHRDQSRAIEVLTGFYDADREVARGREGGRTMTIPIIGDVAAGTPILAEHNVEGEMELDPLLVSDSRSYMLRVRGTSMINAHICDGDLIIIRPQQVARNGEIVVVLIEDSVTLKRFFKREGYIELMPENGDLASLILTPEMGQIRILGKLVGVVRRVS